MDINIYLNLLSYHLNTFASQSSHRYYLLLSDWSWVDNIWMLLRAANTSNTYDVLCLPLCQNWLYFATWTRLLLLVYTHFCALFVYFAPNSPETCLIWHIFLLAFFVLIFLAANIVVIVIILSNIKLLSGGKQKSVNICVSSRVQTQCICCFCRQAISWSELHVFANETSGRFWGLFCFLRDFFPLASSVLVVAFEWCHIFTHNDSNNTQYFLRLCSRTAKWYT